MAEKNINQQGEIPEKKTKRLTLTPVPNAEGLFVGIKKDGKTYSVRKDRHRTFFPD